MVRSQLIITLAFLVGFVALAPFAFAQSQEKENANVWAKAEAKIEAHLKGIDPKMRYAEFKSERLSKYLPEYRVFVGFERNTIGETALFLVNQDAETTDLDDDDRAGISKFLRARMIQVKTPEDAVEFAKFFKELKGAQSYVASLYINTKGFTVFDKRYIEYYYGERADTDWKYTSEKREGGWKVSVTYVGNPDASIIVPPRYEIEVDEKGNFREMSEVRSSVR
jgi:hypothetical protein